MLPFVRLGSREFYLNEGVERGFTFHEFGLGKITFQEVERDFVGRHSESGVAILEEKRESPVIG